MRAALLSLLIATSAYANTNDVGVVVVGEPTMQPQLAAQLDTWLRQHGHNVVPAPLPAQSISTLMDCFVVEDEMCARKVVENVSKTQSVIFAKVDRKADADAETVTLTAYWFAKGRDAIAERRFCERCTDVTLRSTADELMEALAIGTAKDAGKIKVTSSPAGEKVSIDGTTIGVTPLEFELKSGKHDVSVATETRAIEITRGQTTPIDFAVESSSGSSKKLLPYALIGAGGVLLVTGVVLFAMDEDVPAPMGDQPKHYKDTAGVGLGLALTGVAVGSIGGYLLFKSKKSAPVAAIGRDGSYIGWVGRF